MYANFFKRFLDFWISLLALLILAPLLLILIFVGAIAMRGNPFFVQKRPGKIDNSTGCEQLFPLIKFRTMSNAKDENGNLLSDEIRLNNYGKFLRKTSLDELPELFNILIGDMALVGPRPQLVRDMVFMTREQRKRHSVRPGLTGLAQVNGRNNIMWEEKFAWDLRYIEKIRLHTDIKIIFQTIWKVVIATDINRDGTVSDIDFGDYLLQQSKIDQATYERILREANKFF